MNRGMKKPRKIPAQPQDIPLPKELKPKKAGKSSSYLPDMMFGQGGKVPAMKNGKGKK